MKIGTSYQPKLIPGTPFAPIDYAISCGFNTMEFSVKALPEDAELRDHVIEYAQKKGMNVSLHSPFGPNNITATDDERRLLSIAELLGSIDLCQKHGLECVTFHPGRLSADGESEEEKWQMMQKTISEVAEHAKDKRVRIGLENMEQRPFELVHTVDELNRFAFIGESNPYFGVTLDFGHYSTNRIGLPKLEQLKLPIHDVHLSQGSEGKAHKPLTLEGNTMVDLPGAFRVLKDYGYDGFVILEISGDHEKSRKIAESILASL